jgi:hypothetical protein
MNKDDEKLLMQCLLGQFVSVEISNNKTHFLGFGEKVWWQG